MRLLNLFAAFLLTASVSSADSDTLNSLLDQAKKGSASARYDLAMHYLFAKEFSESGIETPPDYSRAALWMRRAAEQGHPKAQYMLGTLYERGRGVRPDNKKAMQWYRQALGNGNHEAACPLAHLYEASDIHPKDPEVTRPCYMR